jgi:hypothetical protein
MGLKVLLFRIEDNSEYSLVSSDSDFSFFRIGSLLYIKDLKPSVNGYIIVCIQSEPNY